MVEIFLNSIVRNIKGIPYFFAKNPVWSSQQHYALVGKLSASLLHDILTPITSLALGSALVEGKNKEELMPLIDQSSSQIREFVSVMREFLNECDKESVVHVNREIRKSIQLMSHKATMHNVQIQFLELHQVHSLTHPLYIYQVAVNLLSNAIDASITCDTKKVILIIKRHGRHYTIECKDYGVGIPEEQHKRIFGSGYTTKTDGNGYGLYSVKRIVTQQLHGSIQVFSDQKEGSLFVCRFPIRE